jgi:hypothetical protein
MILDRLAAVVTRNQFTQWCLLLAGPVGLYGLMWTANLIAGTVTSPTCGAGGIILDASERSGALRVLRDSVPFLAQTRPPPSRCQSVPFSADLANQTLAVTAGLAVTIYILFNLRLRTVGQQLQQTGVITAASLDRSGLADLVAKAARPRYPRAARIAFNIGLLALGLALSGLMYYWIYAYGPIFRDLAQSYGERGSLGISSASLRANWWANHEHHPVNMALGAVVGAIGLFFASKQGIAFFNFTRFAWLARRLKDRAPTEYVPAWLDKNHGWKPVAGLVNLGYLAALVFLSSFAAALYMLRTREERLVQILVAILAAIATTGAIANAGFLGNLVWTVRSLFSASVDRERAELKRRLDEADRRCNPAGDGDSDGPSDHPVRPASDGGRLYLLTRATQLAQVRPYPLSGRAIRALSLAPAIFAVYKFLDEVTRAFGLVL